MAEVKFKRIENSTDINNLPIVDGQITYTKDGKTYLDYETQRVPINGTPDTTMSDSSTNAIANSTVKNYIDTNIEPFEDLKPVVLYNNTSGANGSITLNDAVENYSYIEIYYRNNNSLYSSCKFYSPSGKQLTLSIVYPDSSSNQIWVQSTTKTVTGTSMSNVSGRYIEAETYNKTGIGRNDRIYIVRVVGYK